MRTMILFMIRKNKPNNDKILIADLDPPDDKKSKNKKNYLVMSFLKGVDLRAFKLLMMVFYSMKKKLMMRIIFIM